MVAKLERPGVHRQIFSKIGSNRAIGQTGMARGFGGPRQSPRNASCDDYPALANRPGKWLVFPDPRRRERPLSGRRDDVDTFPAQKYKANPWSCRCPSHLTGNL